MDEKILSKLKLNKKNIAALCLTCQPSKETPKENILSDHFYSQKKSTRKAPLMHFDEEKLCKNIPLIKYLVGQLQIVHDKKGSFTPSQGIFDYTGNKWADDNNALFALYYIGAASLVLPHFVDGEKYAEAQNMAVYYDAGLIPTYPADDPRFNINDAKKALLALGVELPEGQDRDDK